MSTLTVRVARKQPEALDICSLELAAVEGYLPGFSAGAHVDVHLPGGLVRQYSLCNDPAEQHRYVIAVLRDPQSRGGSSAVHDRVQVGDLLQISEPKNHFPLVPSDRAILFAGGIGITPILCMAERLSRTHSRFELHYCTRSAATMAFRQRIELSGFRDRVVLHFDDGPPEQKLQLDSVLQNPVATAHIYVCGPTGFMDWVIAGASERGWSVSQVHREYFAAAPISPDDEGTFEVVLASTGQTFVIPPGQSIVSVLGEANVFIPMSCEQGFCGTCVTRVLEGMPDHRDLYFSDDEKARND